MTVIDDSDAAAAALENGRLLFAGPCEFIAAANNMRVLPPEGLPEICFAGRSNVGKSSLVNALTGRKTLARTSQTPGRTRQLIFFSLTNRIQLVDLPGYGYARAPKTDIKAWTTLTRKFLAGRASLQRVFLLIDSRRGIGPGDAEIMALLDSSAVSWTVVLTKVDKLKQAGIIASGMIPKVDSATTAIDAGVDKVSFVDGRINHAVLLEIFTDEGVGTEIVK